MEPIPEIIVERTMQKLSAMEPDNGLNLINNFADEQPVVIAYLMAFSDSYLKGDEREQLIYMAVAIWQMMSHGEKPLAQITEELLEEKEEKNIRMLEYLAGDSENEFADTVEMIFQGYGQPDVLRYVVETLMDEDAEERAYELSDEGKGHMLICLKTLIDCFDSTPEL